MYKSKRQKINQSRLQGLKPKIVLKGRVKDKTLLKTQQCESLVLVSQQNYHSKTEVQEKYSTKKDVFDQNLQSTPLQNDSLEIFNGSQAAKSFMLVTEQENKINTQTFRQIENKGTENTMFKRVKTISNQLQSNSKYLSSKKSLSKKYLSLVSKTKIGKNEQVSEYQRRGLIEAGSNITKFFEFKRIKQEVGKQPMKKIFSQKYSLISHSSNHRTWCRSQPITIFKQAS